MQTNSRLMVVSVSLVIAIGIVAFYYFWQLSPEIGKPCGGLAGNLPENQCQFPLKCIGEIRSPDAMGTCRL